LKVKNAKRKIQDAIKNSGSSPKELLMPELIFHQKENHKLSFTSPPLFPFRVNPSG
jgi:hypothetical protein